MIQNGYARNSYGANPITSAGADTLFAELQNLRAEVDHLRNASLLRADSSSLGRELHATDKNVAGLDKRLGSVELRQGELAKRISAIKPPLTEDQINLMICELILFHDQETKNRLDVAVQQLRDDFGDSFASTVQTMRVQHGKAMDALTLVSRSSAARLTAFFEHECA